MSLKSIANFDSIDTHSRGGSERLRYWLAKPTLIRKDVTGRDFVVAGATVTIIRARAWRFSVNEPGKGPFIIETLPPVSVHGSTSEGLTTVGHCCIERWRP